jgi:hypothetical protein
MMIRIPVRLRREQCNALHRLSAVSGKSTAALIRNAIDQYLSTRPASQGEDRIERAIRVAGKFASGNAGVSADHDRHLAGTFRR